MKAQQVICLPFLSEGWEPHLPHIWGKVLLCLVQTPLRAEPVEILLERSALVGCITEVGFFFSCIQATGIHSHCLSQKASPSTRKLHHMQGKES